MTVQEFIGERVMVEARLRKEADPLPLAFSWRGQRFEIESWGRETTRTRGHAAVSCYLVQTVGPETWELCLDKKKAQWTLIRRWATQTRMV